LPKQLAAQFASLDHRRFCIRDPRKGVQPDESGIFVRSTAGLTFREKYSFLTLYAARLPV
jgi:hypothetical protein